MVIQVEIGRSRGVRGERTEHTKIFRRTLAGFGLTWHRKVNFSTFDGKLELHCTRNGPQNLPYCPGSVQDTFIIYSSISHQHLFRKYVGKRKNSNIENLKILIIDPGKLKFRLLSVLGQYCSQCLRLCTACSKFATVLRSAMRSSTAPAIPKDA